MSSPARLISSLSAAASDAATSDDGWSLLGTIPCALARGGTPIGGDATDLFAAHGTGAEVRFDFPEFRRLQRASQVLFQVFHHHSVHNLPLKMQ